MQRGIRIGGMYMIDVAKTRLRMRRSKRYWVAALCAASFACGHCLFGDDQTGSSDSLLSQYQQATKQLVNEAPSARRQLSGTKIESTGTTTVAPAQGAAPSNQTANSESPAKQQKSSRRVKPTEEKKESSVAKADSPPEPVLEDKTEIAKQSTVPSTAASSPTVEAKSPPAVTYIEVPRQTAEVPKRAEPRMEIITAKTASTDSPRSAYPVAEPKLKPSAQSPAGANVPFVAAKPIPNQSDSRPAPASQPTPSLPQLINVSRQSPPFPQVTNTPAAISEVDEDHLPPIVSPASVPRPGTRKPQPKPAPQATPVLRIELGAKQP